jgi:hypothetical protein
MLPASRAERLWQTLCAVRCGKVCWQKEKGGATYLEVFYMKRAFSTINSAYEFYLEILTCTVILGSFLTWD